MILHDTVEQYVAKLEAQVKVSGEIIKHLEARELAIEVIGLRDKLVEVTANRADLHARWLDEQESRKRAEAEVARLRGALRDLLRDVDARLSLDSGFKGMGHNIATESAGRLRIDAEYARRVLLRGEGEKP